jgi:hypothetical protein
MAVWALLLVLLLPSAESSVADTIGHFNPYDTVNRFPPAASAQDAATRGFCQAPVKKQLRFDVAPDWEMANTICCHNTKYAEPSGYFNTDRVKLFSRFKVEEKSHTFYDSVCGVPLFTAPVGRTMAEWQVIIQCALSALNQPVFGSVLRSGILQLILCIPTHTNSPNRLRTAGRLSAPRRSSIKTSCSIPMGRSALCAGPTWDTTSLMARERDIA